MYMNIAACLKGATGNNCELCVHCKYGNGSNWCQHDGNCSYGCVSGWTDEKCNGMYCTAITAAFIYSSMIYNNMISLCYLNSNEYYFGV